MSVQLRRSDHATLPGPYSTMPQADGIAVSPAVHDLVGGQVRALLHASPAYYAMPESDRAEMEHNLTKIAAYSAALLQDGFQQAEKLGQTPVLREQKTIEPVEPPAPAAARAAPAAAQAADRAPLARAAAESPFAPRAVGEVARVTEETLNAIDFPSFVADLIRGTFNAIVNASIQQMEAYGELLANVAKTVDQFMADNITDNQARDYLAGRYPGHFAVDPTGEAPRVQIREGADELPRPDFRGDLGLSEDVDVDPDTVEEVLVPAARRSLASSRHQLLSTMVLMGINRIVVTSGRLRARMDFHIDASDTGRAETASQFDFKHESQASAGFFGFKAKTKTSVAYVRTAKQVATDEINVEADLMGELDLRFKSETFPLERFAETDVVARIQAGTANPAANPAAGPTPTQTG